ncbi:uncharacterized protein HMPREF1541_10983 [Cyphellophora europaea CBS 101466]|uniref:Uncharacterized protein n=1 Tax=Cyphellophora europaea (strain CBS 101466) TaxID=1220924 RepID=W2S593_CYPE1|nr:uncharacterized protein HMPREF1541_10983 [Cyphellophora europaea CBS 101466]ETN43852.1 hypothetical protein HMPREF1541_10983 [Cyphellophora europaea CBS 101466]
MYCLRTFLPLLLLPLPLSLSPIHLATFLLLTYILARPCSYCSFLLVILFASSCYWSGRCFWESPVVEPTGAISAGCNGTGVEQWAWLPYFLPRLYTTPSPSIPTSASSVNATANTGSTEDFTSFLLDLTNSTLSTLGSSAASSVMASSSAMLAKVAPSISIPTTSMAGAVGTQWLGKLLGRGEWTLPCVGVRVVL